MIVSAKIPSVKQSHCTYLLKRYHSLQYEGSAYWIRLPLKETPGLFLNSNLREKKNKNPNKR